MLRALLWDVDGTIAETERDGHRVAFNRAFAAHGLGWHWDVPHYARLLAVAGGYERLLVDMEGRADAPCEQSEREALARSLHMDKNRRYAQLVDDRRIEARAGVLQTFADARAQALAQAIVTTTSRVNVEALMKQLLGASWPTYFDALVCAEDAGRKKPDPQAYLLALERLGIAGPDALAIEDSPAGATAARAAAIPVLLRPSEFFPAAATPPALRGCLMPDGAWPQIDGLRDWHRRNAS